MHNISSLFLCKIPPSLPEPKRDEVILVRERDDSPRVLLRYGEEILQNIRHSPSQPRAEVIKDEVWVHLRDRRQAVRLVVVVTVTAVPGNVVTQDRFE